MIDSYIGWGEAGHGEPPRGYSQMYEDYLKEREKYGKHGVIRGLLCKSNKHVKSIYSLDLTCKYCGKSYGSYEDRIKLEEKGINREN